MLEQGDVAAPNLRELFEQLAQRTAIVPRLGRVGILIKTGKREGLAARDTQGPIAEHALGINTVAPRSELQFLKPAVHAPPERALATNRRREAGARTAQSLVAGSAAAAFHTSPAVEDASEGHDEYSRKCGRPSGPESHSQPGARNQPSHDFRHAPPQRKYTHGQRQQDGDHPPRKRRAHHGPDNDPRDQAHGEKRATLAYA